MTEVKAELVGNLWKIVVEVGQAVEEDDTLMILESMKMEIRSRPPSRALWLRSLWPRARWSRRVRRSRSSTERRRSPSRDESGGRRRACDDESVNSSQLDTISVKTSDNVTLGYSVAGLGSRLVAQILDNLLAIPITLIALLLYGALSSTFVTTSQGAFFAGAGAGVFAGFAYFGYFFIAETVTGGKTPGKSAMGLRVIRVDGSAADFGAIAVRNVIRVIDVGVVLIGIVVMFFQPQTRRLGDLGAGTIVIRDRAMVSLAAAVAPPPIILRTPDAGPPIDGLDRIGSFERDALRVFLSRAGLSPKLRADLAADIAGRLLDRLGLPLGAPERLWPPELFIERVYLQLDPRYP